jgi:hypothetical protein
MRRIGATCYNFWTDPERTALEQRETRPFGASRCRAHPGPWREARGNDHRALSRSRTLTTPSGDRAKSLSVARTCGAIPGISVCLLPAAEFFRHLLPENRSLRYLGSHERNRDGQCPANVQRPDGDSARTWRPSNAIGGAGILPDRRWLMAAEVVIKQFLRLEARKPLKTLVSDERMQGNPRKSNT